MPSLLASAILGYQAYDALRPWALQYLKAHTGPLASRAQHDLQPITVLHPGNRHWLYRRSAEGEYATGIFSQRIGVGLGTHLWALRRMLLRTAVAAATVVLVRVYAGFAAGGEVDYRPADAG